MRVLPLLVFLVVASFKALAAIDDTLPKGVPSRFLVFPFVLRSPETSWGFGGAGAFFFKAGKEKDELRTSDVNLLSLFTLNKQTVIVLGSTIFFPGEKKIFRFQGSYSYYPDLFWGLGNDSYDSSRVDYTLKQTFINPQFIIRFYRRIFAGLSFEWQRIRDFNYSPGSIFDTQNITGREGGLTVGAGLLLTFDSRNNAYSPSKGTFVEINITDFAEGLGSDFSFVTYLLDFRKFLLAGRNRVLAFQFISRFNNGDAPIRNLSMIGGTEMMRGYYKGRYMDKNLIAFQSELRQYLIWRIGVVAFASAGQVGAKVNEFKLNDFHYAYGAGLRVMLHEKEKLNLRLDFGFGKESSGVYVILKEAF